MIRQLLPAAVALIVATACSAAATSRPTTAPAGLPHVHIDVSAGTVTVETKVVLTRGPLEFLACLTGTKEHESILATDALPSHVHAGLLAMGLAPGRGGHWARSAEGEHQFAPPAGAELQLTLRWTDAQGRPREARGAEWIRSIDPDKPVDLRWVFVGSAPLAGRGYPADRSGELISVANFPRAVIDVPFASSTEAEFLSFQANSEAIPPVGTKVALVLSLTAGAAEAKVARAAFEIDRFGRFHLGGLAIDAGQIGPWARGFRARHERPYIVVNVAGRALAADIHKLKSLLHDADIDDIEIVTKPIAGEILPRTAEQAIQAIHRWRDRFARAAESVDDPAPRADTVLRQIEYRREELNDLLKLWAAYRDQLAASLAAHRQDPPNETQEPTP